MWLNQQIGEHFRQEYSIEEKILDVRSEHILEIFKSPNFGQIALLDEREILIQDFLYVECELLAHIPLCCVRVENENPKVLILGGFNLEMSTEIFKHNASVDFIQSDIKVLDSFINFFPHFTQIKANPNFHLYTQATDLPTQKYDVIIHQGIPSTHDIDVLCRMLTSEGILIHKLPHPFIAMDRITPLLQTLGHHFNIIMPFYAPLWNFTNQCYVFASKLTHPLADMWLQRADMLMDLRYYNADIHQTAFSLPTNLAHTFKGIIKN